MTGRAGRDGTSRVTLGRWAASNTTLQHSVSIRTVDMAPHDDPRNPPDRPEDNPFIAFRRFADSQVSTLLNTVVTLPATIANHHNAHIAREHCLFGRADKTQCDRLSELERRIAAVRSEGRELYRVGDLHAVQAKGEELMRLDREADVVRKNIVESASTGEAETPARTQADLVERVANEKGQEWGWSWSWGFPKAFDDNDNARDDSESTGHSCRRWRRRREEARLQHAEEARVRQAEEEWTRFNEKWDEKWETLKKRIEEEQQHDGCGHRQPRVWSWSFQWPPPADAPKPDASPNSQSPLAQLRSIVDDIGIAIAAEVPRIFDSPSYSPRALEENKDLRCTGVDWRDAFEDLVRAEHGAPLIPPQQLGQWRNRPYDEWANQFHDPRCARANFAQWLTHPEVGHSDGQPSSEEPSYEYGHDHEDQHDDPPTPKARQDRHVDEKSETELDAYERLLGRAYAPGTPMKEIGRPSVFSELTTTERTVAPDGTVTTKVVLKKRFADGREESSETVHTQRGQDDSSQQDPWRAMQDAQFPRESSEQPGKKNSEKKSGWFWSS